MSDTLLPLHHNNHKDLENTEKIETKKEKRKKKKLQHFTLTAAEVTDTST